MKKLQDLDVKNKKILLRVDFNVPINNGRVGEDFRIEAVKPTIDYLLKNGASQIILISHLGRPDGKFDKNLSLRPITQKLANILELNEVRIKDIKSDGFPGFRISDNIILLENIRFYKEEEKSDRRFAKKLASLGNIFIFDAFGAAHRESASCTGVARILPEGAGLLVQKEIEELDKLLRDPEKPFCVILGGAKTEDKLPVIKNLYGKVQVFITGGGIANTFLAAKEFSIGKSVYAPNLKEEAHQVMQMILSEPGRDIFIPQDFVVSKSREKPIQMRTLSRAQVKPDDFIVDIGPETLKMIEPKIKEAETIFWNGTMGVAEVEDFSFGTKRIAKMIVDSKSKSVAAGGDTVAAINKFGLLRQFDFVSTGGGAALEYLAGKRLPALEVLE